MVKIGSVYTTNHHGEIVVLEKCQRTDFYKVRFKKTGTEKDVRGYQILCGCIRDPMAKSLCGVACTGNAKTKGQNKVFYAIWHDMINRCYNPSDKRYVAYQHVRIAERWLVFEHFLQDIRELDGFDAMAIMDGRKCLDKDLKQRGLPEKIYSTVWPWQTPRFGQQDWMQRYLRIYQIHYLLLVTTVK